MSEQNKCHHDRDYIECDKCTWGQPIKFETGNGGVEISSTKPFKIGIDKEYFREKFERVILDWENESYLIEGSIGASAQNELLEKLMKCFDEGK